MFKFNNVARVNLVETKNLKKNKYRLVCAFHVTETFINASLTESFKFPQQKKCNYVSGDFHINNLDREIARAKRHLRTERLEFTKHFPEEYEGDDSIYTFVYAHNFMRF
jgi:hypothetical protein